MKHDTGLTQITISQWFIWDIIEISPLLCMRVDSFSSLKLNADQSHIVRFAKKQKRCASGQRVSDAESQKTTEPLWMQIVQLRSHPFAPDIAGDRSSLLIAANVMTLWCAVRAVNAWVWLGVAFCEQKWVLFGKNVLHVTQLIYEGQLSHWYVLLWLKRDHALSYQSRPLPVELSNYLNLIFCLVESGTT